MKVGQLQPDLNTTRVASSQGLRLGLIFAAYLLVGASSGGFGVLLPEFSAFYQLEKSTTGLLFLAGSGGYLVAAFVSGWLVERLGLRYFLLLGLLLFGLACLALVLQPLFALVLVARLVLGLSIAILETGGNFYVAALPRNTALFNYLHAFFGGGALLGPIIATTVLSYGWGWASFFFICAMGSLGLGIGFALAFRTLPATFQTTKPTPEVENQPSAEASENNKSGTARNSMIRALKLPTVWLAALFLLVYVGGESSVGSWTYTFLTEGQLYAPALAGWLVSGYWLGLTLGRLVLAWGVERLGLAGRDRTLLMGCIIMAMAGAVLVWLFSGQPLVAGFGLLIVGFSFGPIYPTTLAVLSKLVPPKLLPSSIALITSLSILGIAVFPWLAGLLLQWAGSATLFPYVIGLCGAMIIVGVFLLKPAKSSTLKSPL